jgi:hypothetical protein
MRFTTSKVKFIVINITNQLNFCISLEVLSAASIPFHNFGHPSFSF